MSQYGSKSLEDGTTLQAGIPRTPARSNGALQAQGLLLRGVVTNTWVLDSEEHPYKGYGAVAVYCDVLCYSGPPSMRWRFLPSCLVSQDSGNMQSGHVWKPRAAKKDISKNPLDLNSGSNPAQWDGDHVLVGFLDDSLNQPVILRGIPHPSRDIGHENRAIGHRTGLKLVDGDPNFWKHHGTFFGVADNGDFVVDTTFANDGTNNATGDEPAPSNSKGSVTFKAPKGATYSLQLHDMASPDVPVLKAKLELQEGALTFTITGATPQHVAVVEPLQVLYGALSSVLTTFNSHTHPAPGGTTSATTQPMVVPAWNSAINSTKVIVPGG